MMGFWDAVASAGPHANNLHLAPDNHTNTPSLNFYRPDALSGAQPIVSMHWRQLSMKSNKIETHFCAVLKHSNSYSSEILVAGPEGSTRTPPVNVQNESTSKLSSLKYIRIHSIICRKLSGLRQPITLNSLTGQMPFLAPNQQCQSTEGKSTEGKWIKKMKYEMK